MFKYQSLNELIYSEIKERIISNRYAPEARLDIDNISKELGVSRTPIINALKALEKDGYVTILPRSGTFVKKYSKDEIEALFDFREALEGVVAKKAVHLAKKEVLLEYEQSFLDILENISRVDLLQNVESYYALQTEFHSYLWKLCPAIISNELQNILDLTKRICKRHLTFSAMQKDAKSFFENEILTHIHIVRAILNQDMQEAAKWMYTDISQTKDAILKNYDEIEGYAAEHAQSLEVMEKRI